MLFKLVQLIGACEVVLPLLSYCLAALELNHTAINDLVVAWNNAFRRIFSYNRWESVKQLQYFCGCLDYKHLYDVARYRFLSDISNRLVYLSGLFTSLEFHYHSLTMLHFRYAGNCGNCHLLMLSTNIFDVMLWRCISV